MPLPPSWYRSGPVSPQQVNTDLYGIPAAGPSGVLFHGNRPLLSETVMTGGTAYAETSAQPVEGSGIQAFSVIDTTALVCQGADSPGNNSQFRFSNYVPASAGTAGGYGGNWLTWGFPVTEPVTVPPGGVGAGMALNGTFTTMGTFQYGGTGNALNCPYYLDIVNPGSGSSSTWQPAFWWLTASVPIIRASTADTSGEIARMGWLWHSVGSGGSVLPSVPSVASSWGTVTSAMLNGMGSALALLNNPPALRVASASAQSIPNSTTTQFTFGNSAPGIDNYAGWSTSSTAYTAPLNGLYLFAPTIIWGTASSSGLRWSGLTVTAGGSAVTHQGPGYAASPVGPGVSGVGLTGTGAARVLALNTGDTVSAVGAHDAGVAVPLYTGYASRLIGAWLCPQAGTGTTLAYAPPVTSFRFQAGALQGTALAGTLGSRIGNDVNFLLNRPYFTGFQKTSQSGFANNSGYHQVTIDTLGALPRGGNGDNYGGWSTANSWYASQAAGWYLVMAEVYATPPVSGDTGTLAAAIYVSTSGGVTPAVSPDTYQQSFYPEPGVATAPGAFAAGCYYLDAGEYVYPMIWTENYGGTWGTYVNSSTTSTIHSQFTCMWLSN